MNNDPPSTTDLSIENPENTSNKNANTLVPTVEDSGTQSEAGQGQDRQKLCSDSTDSQDIPGILKIVPSNEDVSMNVFVHVEPTFGPIHFLFPQHSFRPPT